MNLTEEKKLKILFVIGGCIFAAIIYILVFSFDSDIETERKKVGLIILGDMNEKGWNASHYNGLKSACEEFNLDILVKDHIKENSGQCPKAIEDLISEGARVIVLASFAYANEVRPIIEKNPNIAFINVTTLEETKNVTSCFARMYQGRYMSGVLAGMKTKTDKVGYVAAMPNTEVNRGINAFALGVQRVNPDAKVFVMWTGDWQNEEVEKKHAETLIKDYDADVLTYHQDVCTTGKVAEKFGVDFIAYNEILEDNSEHYLASIVCHWDLFYKDILQRYSKGELSAIRNNWVGAEQGVITLQVFSDSVTQEMRTKLDEISFELAKNNNLIFVGEIYDNTGKLHCERHQVISDKELLKNIDWLIEGVEVVE